VGFVPPGYDRWMGLVGNSRYYDYTLSVDGRPESHAGNYSQDYLTDLLVSKLWFIPTVNCFEAGSGPDLAMRAMASTQ